MPTIDLVLPRPHEGQLRIRREARRFNAVACGRRFGKTVLGQDRLVEPALTGLPVGWFSPTYKMLAEVWRELRRTLAPVTSSVNAQLHRLELITGGVVDMWSLDNPDAARGRKYARVVIDEAAMVPALGDAWQAVIRPTLTDYEGDAWLLSTPRGRNFFWWCFQWGQDPARTDWASWQMPTLANPYIRASEVEAARRELPERTFQQEYLAAFLEDAGGVFRGAATVSTLGALEGPLPGRSYIGGVDWARSEDFTVFSVLDATTREQVAVDRFNRIDYEYQLHRFRALHDRFDVQLWIVEENSMGGPLVSRLRREGYPVRPFVTTQASKQEIIDGLALALERQELRLLADPVQLAELQAYEMERLPSGRFRYGAPEGMHDDTVMALALAWWGVGGRPKLTSAQVDWYGQSAAALEPPAPARTEHEIQELLSAFDEH